MEEDNNITIKEKKDLHLLRKFFHMLPGLFIVYLVQAQVFTHVKLMLLLGFCFILSLIVDTIRIKYNTINKMAIGLSKYIIRKEEIKEFSGIPYYLGGCFLVLLAFNKDIASLSILYLAIGDPFASFMGIQWGQESAKFKNGKSLVGTIGGIICCIIITMLYGTYKEWDLNSLYAISFFGGLAGGLSETFSFEELNDNFFIPFVSAVVLSIVFSNYFVVV